MPPTNKLLMRILFISREQLLPVSERVGESARSIIAAMASRGHDVTVLAPLQIGDEEIKRMQDRYRVRLVRFPLHKTGGDFADSLARTVTFCLGASAYVTYMSLKERYDVIFLSNCPLISVTKPLARLWGGLFVLSMNYFVAGLSSKGKAPMGLVENIFFSFERRAVNLLDMVFVPSQKMKMLLLGGGCQPSRIHVTYDGVDTDRFDIGSVNDNDVSWIRAESGIERKMILFRSAIELETAQELKAVVEEVLKKRNDVVFIISGEGAKYDAIRSKFKSENVKFVGPIPSELITSYLAAANVSLVVDGGSLGNDYLVKPEILESLVMGLQVVSTESRSARELFGIHDFIRFSDLPQELACHILELIERPKSTDAVNIVRERYSLKQIAANIADLVEVRHGKGR
jgi:glycosyltransferase involved in cell wall biosynthesis